MWESDKFADAGGGHTAEAALPCTSWLSSSLHMLLFWLSSGEWVISTWLGSGFTKANEERIEAGDDIDIEKSGHDTDDTQAVSFTLLSCITLQSNLGAIGNSSVRPSCLDVVT
jgi:hypothetical protein